MSFKRFMWFAAALASMVMLVALGVPTLKHGGFGIALGAAMCVYLVIYHVGVLVESIDARWTHKQLALQYFKYIAIVVVLTALPFTLYLVAPGYTAATIHWIFFIYLVLEGSIQSRDHTKVEIV